MGQFFLFWFRFRFCFCCCFSSCFGETRCSIYAIDSKAANTDRAPHLCSQAPLADTNTNCNSRAPLISTPGDGCTGLEIVMLQLRTRYFLPTAACTTSLHIASTLHILSANTNLMYRSHGQLLRSAPPPLLNIS